MKFKNTLEGLEKFTRFEEFFKQFKSNTRKFSGLNLAKKFCASFPLIWEIGGSY
jgi:hypothetical protein